MSEPFRIGYTADFLKPDGAVGWGDIGLGRYEGIDVSFLPRHEPVLTADLAAHYDALAVLAPKVPAELIDNAPRLAIIVEYKPEILRARGEDLPALLTRLAARGFEQVWALSDSSAPRRVDPRDPSLTAWPKCNLLARRP